MTPPVHLVSLALLLAQKINLCLWDPLLIDLLLCWPIRIFILHSPMLPFHAQLPTYWVTISAAANSVSCISYVVPSLFPFRSRTGNSFSQLLLTKISLIKLLSGFSIPSSQLGFDLCLSLHCWVLLLYQFTKNPSLSIW